MLDRVAQRYGVTPAELLRLSLPELTLTLRCADVGIRKQPAQSCPMMGGRRG